MLYPLSGFIADVYCKRLRVAVISLSFILAFTLLLCSLEIIGFATNALAYRNYSVYVSFHNAKGITLLPLILVSLVSFIIGLAGYQANMIQLGPDQLLKHPVNI